MEAVGFLDRDNIEEIKRKVSFYINVQRFDAAEKLLKVSLANHGSVANLHNLLGVVLHRQSRFPEATQQFELAIKRNPAFVEAHLNLAIILSDLSRYADAQDVFQKILTQMHPVKPTTKLLVGRIANQHAQNARLYFESGLYDDAINELEKALTLHRPMPDVQLLAAKLYLGMDKLDKAKRELEDLVEAVHDHVLGKNLLALVYYKMGRTDTAKSLWTDIVKDHPRDEISQAYLKLLKSNEKH